MPALLDQERRAYSPPAGERRVCLSTARWRLSSTRRRFEAAVGRVATRGLGACAARRTRAARRARASSRLRSWARKRRASMTSTPSRLIRFLARRSRRSPHLFGQRLGAAHVETQLHRARHLVDVLPARSGGAHEAPGELVLAERDDGSGLQHGGFGYAVSVRASESTLSGRLAPSVRRPPGRWSQAKASSMPRATAGRCSMPRYQRATLGNSSSATPCHS